MAERPVRSSEIRSAFLEFFRSREHEIVASGPLVPPNDPSLYFANSGMVQFKDVFTGREQRSYKRAATSQKCMRVSGKHNDLENVGPSPNHHTLFEMLGNFSFGDYFKEKAITYGWEFVTGVLGLPPERLATTYLRGTDNLPADTEARDLWKRIAGLPEERIIGCGPEDNFWRMGDTGPCGPSSEIFFWKGEEPVDISRFGQDAAPDGSGWVEIWNLVFMQFERKPDGALDRLPAPSVDTGMGLERVTCIQQGKTSSYDTDLLRPLVEKVAQLSGKPYGASMSADDVSMRVIADHARATAFLIADGVLPDRAGRAYVLRRVMRRAIRHGHRLGIERPFLHEVALEVVRLLGDHYSELRERREMIASVAEQEEVRFRETIVRGLGLLEQAFEGMASRGERVLPGEDAFKLYDTYGFPLDLTQVICAERGYEVDTAGYEQALEEARKRSEFKGAEQAVEGVYRAVLERVPNGRVDFTGYERDEDSSEVVALVGEGAVVERLDTGARGEVVTAKTPFYGEAGGQAGDHGEIRFPGGVFVVEDTQKPLDGLVVHRGVVQSGSIAVGTGVSLVVDSLRRNATRRNHSATHLLHYALRKVVGPQAQQKGSLVGPDRLRFDFTHGTGLSEAQLGAIEDTVNELIVENHTVRTQVLPLDQARTLGAMMIFEEKYGSTVRMLSMGPSTELCGGTHARATGDIGLFKILQEQGVAAGIRRIVATTGLGSLAYVRSLEDTLARASRIAKAGGVDLVDKIERLVAQQKVLEKQLDEAQRRWMQGSGGGADSLISGARDVAGVRVLGVKTLVTDRSALRELAEQLRDKLGDSVVLVGSEHEGKVQLVLTVAKGLTGRYKAGELIRGIAQVVGGSGGGRPDMAQAGGSDVSRLDEAVAAIYDSVASVAA
ncbi:MAG TPA: alanine--tRNA ligase [Polyangiaceae bacterium]|nr:alanine--tRNA ligase [Polyangiaceae bacterium]